MHDRGFLFGMIPILGLFFIFCMTLIAIPTSKFDSAGSYVLAGLVSQVAVMGFRILWVARKSHLHFSRKHKRLPETPSIDTEEKFGIHVVEELLKFALLAIFMLFLAQDRYSLASYILLVGTVFAANKLVCTVVTFSPINYEENYAKFAVALEKFVSRSCVSNDKISLHSADSSASQNSDDTTDGLFKLNSFNPQMESPSALPIPGSPDPFATQFKSIDRFYSVSPKDTMHLTYEQISDSPNSDWTTSAGKPEDCFETSLAKSCGPSVEFKAPESSSQNSQIDVSLLEVGEKNECSWWAWLFPWCNKKEKKSKSPRKRERALIKKKLSTFTLNSQISTEHEKRSLWHGESETSSLKSASSYHSYGTVDLESQQIHVVVNSHTFYEFARFANKFLDFWSPSLQGLLRCIDPSFMKFGAPITETPTFYFIIYGASTCMWQASSTLLLAVPLLTGKSSLLLFISAFIILLTARLFCANYLHGQCRLSYKFSIGAEFSLNIALFVFAYFCFYRLVSNF